MYNKKTEKLFIAAIALYLLIIIFPFIWVTLTSFKPESEIWGSSALKLFADKPTLEHYEALFKAKIFNSLKNSLIISSITAF